MYPVLNLPYLPPVSTYFLIISVATSLSAAWFLRRARGRELSRVTAIDLTLVILIAGFLGARLFHIAYEEPDFYAHHPLAILYVWNGGFVYLGGLIAAFLAALYFCQSRGEPFWLWADVAAPPLGLGYALGRLGCLANGCCYGRECHLPWAVHLHGADRHPTQAYAALWTLAVVIALTWTEGRWRRTGTLFHAFIIAFSLGRVGMELFRDDPRGPAFLGLSISLWISLSVAVAAACNWLKPRPD